jgi:hypothetical protein
MFKKITPGWLYYHLRTFVEQVVVFHPFRIPSVYPLRFYPGGRITTFIFGLFCSVLIYLPLIFFFLAGVANGVWMPEAFIITIFGIAFGTIYRSIQDDSCTYLIFDNQNLDFVTYGFYEKTIERIEHSQFSGLTLLKSNVRGTKNYKICLVLNDGRILLLRLNLFEQKTKKQMDAFSQAFRTSILQNVSGMPINDHNFSWGGSTS